MARRLSQVLIALATTAIQSCAPVVAPAWCAGLVEPGPPDRVLDDFEAQPQCTCVAQGDTSVQIEPRPGMARRGSQSILVRIDAGPQESPRHVAQLAWEFSNAKDLSQYEGVQFWVQPFDDVHIQILVHEAGSTRYRARPALAWGQEGQWQQVRVGFRHFAWDFESKPDDNKNLDLDQVKAISLWVQVKPGSSTAFALDELGLYKAPPPYAGPKVSLKCAKPACVFEPGEEMVVTARVEDLPARDQAKLDIAVTDFWGKEILAQHHDLAGAHAPTQYETKFAGIGYFDVTASLTHHGRAVWKEHLGIATIPPLPGADAVAPPDSIFGTWVGGLGIPRRYGVRWYRTYCQPWDFEPDPETGQYRYVREPGQPFRFHEVEGMEPILFFRGMPLWLTSRPDRVDYRKFKPESWDEYARFVEYYCSLVKNDVDFYEVWNEPVPYAYWMGTIEEVVKLHEVTYKAVHAADPTATVLGPCPYSFVWDFIDRFFELGGGKWIDAIVLHTYTPTDPDSGEFRENLRRVRDLAARHGLDKDLFVTEMGYSTPQVTERQQAEYLVRAHVLAMVEGVKVLIWHMFWDYVGDPDSGPGFALFRHDMSPRPALVALATTIRKLGGARYEAEIGGLPGKCRGFRFVKDGKEVCVLWCWDAQPQVAEMEWRGAAPLASDIMGVESEMEVTRSGLRVALTGSPVFVQER